MIDDAPSIPNYDTDDLHYDLQSLSDRGYTIEVRTDSMSRVHGVIDFNTMKIHHWNDCRIYVREEFEK